MSIEWKEFIRRHIELTREEAREMCIMVFKFIGRFLWAKLTRKEVVKNWFIMPNGNKTYFLCAKTEEVIKEDTKCSCCYTECKSGSEMSKLTRLVIFEDDEPEDISEIFCKECADAVTDEERVEAHMLAVKQKLYIMWNLEESAETFMI